MTEIETLRLQLQKMAEIIQILQQEQGELRGMIEELQAKKRRPISGAFPSERTNT